MPLIQTIAYPLTLVGILIIFAGLVPLNGQFRAMATRHEPGGYSDTPNSLITDGVFQFSRNPGYVGQLLITLGVALLLGSLTPLLITLLAFVAMSYWVIPPEEKLLEQTFGSQYTAYKKRVRRWL